MAPQRKTFPATVSCPDRAVPAGRRARLLCGRPSAAITRNGRACGPARGEFLTPWEPTWPPDALSRASFRARVARYAEDWRTDQGYNFFIFAQDETLAGGVGLSNLRRGVAETASLGYWVGEAVRPSALHDARPCRSSSISPSSGCGLHRVEAACLPTNIPSRALLARAGFQQEGYARNISDRRQMAGPPPLRDPARGLGGAIRRVSIEDY